MTSPANHMNKKTHLLKKKDMAESCGISIVAFDKWGVEPVFREGRSAYFSVRDVLDNRLANAEKKQKPDIDLDIVKERARLTHHQANIAELDEEVKRGELIPAYVVEQVWGDMLASFRAKILSVPTKAAHQFVALTDLSEIQDALKEHLCEALTELSEYEPNDYGVQVSKERSREDSAAA